MCVKKVSVGPWMFGRFQEGLGMSRIVQMVKEGPGGSQRVWKVSEGHGGSQSVLDSL